MLKAEKFKPALIFGDMENSERDEMIKKFRERKVQVVIITNILARGFDLPDIGFIINLDVPKRMDQKGVYQPDYETYLHRIGRTGRFGCEGTSLTLFDNEEDEQLLFEIIDNYDMRPLIKKIDNASDLVKKLSEYESKMFE